MSRIIQVADERGEFVYLEDGFLYYEPKGAGVLTAHELRTIADELDRRNKDWDDQINEYFSNRPGSEAVSGMDGGQTCGENGS